MGTTAESDCEATVKSIFKKRTVIKLCFYVSQAMSPILKKKVLSLLNMLMNREEIFFSNPDVWIQSTSTNRASLDKARQADTVC